MSDPFDDATPVHGLVDARRAAAMLGVSVNVFKVWANRSQEAKGGIAAAMPKPIAKLHGQVYLAEEIEAFGRLLAMNQRGPRTRERHLGAYFTPESAAELMVSWAIRSPDDVLLEPSLGDGRFARAAQALAAARNWRSLQLHGCELDPEAATHALRSGAVHPDLLHIGDFLAEKKIPHVDAVIGNPPYVRVRELAGGLRASALLAARETLGEDLDPAGSVWMPFVAKAAKHLKIGGRLALVLPLDFTYVRYARPLWRHLGHTFGRLRVIRFRERVFSDILQNVLILLAEEKGKTTDNVELIARDRLVDIQDGLDVSGASVAIESIVRGERGFQQALLSNDTRDVLSLLEAHSSPALHRVKFNIGYVSGNKTFFHPSTDVVRRLRLPKRSLIPTAASSRDFSRQPLRTCQMEQAASLWLPSGDLTKGEMTYIAQGEREGVDMAFKCRIRKPWYVVPGVKVPDVFLTTFSDLPRLHLNDAGWASSNSVLGGFLRPGNDAEKFVDSWYTPLTLLSAEMEVHSLGGGVMVAVPREADSVRMLNADVTYRGNRRQLDAALRSGNMTGAYDVGSKSITKLVGQDGLAAIKKGTETLAAWRKAEITPV